MTETTEQASERQAELANLDYVLLNVEKNLWLTASGHTKELSEAKVVKRDAALQAFVDCVSTRSGNDYDVPIRLIDAVTVSMGLEE